MKPVPHLTHCAVNGPTSLRLRFRDGWNGVLDLGPALRGPIFGALRRPQRFREVTVQDGTLVWPNGADICPDVLRYWCELGRVCSQQELDEHFTAMYAITPAKVAEAAPRYAVRRRSKTTKRTK